MNRDETKPTLIIATLLAGWTALAATPATGPLRVSKENPRYFTDGTGKAIYLTGSHTWNNLQDMGPTDPPAAFDFRAYLAFLEQHHHNFIRLWRWQWNGCSPSKGPVPWAERLRVARQGHSERLSLVMRCCILRGNESRSTSLLKLHTGNCESGAPRPPRRFVNRAE